MRYLALPTLALLVSVFLPLLKDQAASSESATSQLWSGDAWITTVQAQERVEPDQVEPGEAVPESGEQLPEGNPEMTLERMTELILQLDENATVEGNIIEFTFAERTIVMLSAPDANRMRLVSGIMDANAVSDDQLLATLVSNYHLALDARYAIGNGILFSVYVHPLAELDASQLLSGIRQVASLAETFGTTYSSGELSFGVGQQEEKVDI